MKKDVSLISNVKEVESCVYEVDFVNGVICNHWMYKKLKNRNLFRISCEMEKGEGGFRGFSVDDYTKAAIVL